MPLPSETEVVAKIIQWAAGHEGVCTIVQTGSRAHPQAVTDLFSDYDIEVGVAGIQRFSENEEWLHFFGNIHALLRDEGPGFFMRLVLYTNFLRIDFKVYEFSFLDQYLLQKTLPHNWNNGYRVLVDKAHVLQHLPLPSFAAFAVQKPSEDEFARTVHDFFWDITYVAKSLWRGELYYAKYMLDTVIRFSYLQKMIDWSVGCRNNWKINNTRNGRCFQQSLDAEIRAQLDQTLAGKEADENWRALWAMINLFRQLALSLSEALKYPYPHQADEALTSYVKKIALLPSNAASFD